MTLDEAIKHAEEKAEEQQLRADNWTKEWDNGFVNYCNKCAEEHRQLAEWLKELKAYRQMTEPEKVTCATCGHLDIQNVQGQAAPVGICRAKIWDRLHKAPHVIGHDPCLPILCNYYEQMEGTRWNL